MAKTTHTEHIAAAPDRQHIVPVNIVREMKDSFIDYAMSVITDRALPDVRDGLKPVHRRILYSMHENGLVATAKFRKSATVVGDVLGKYHPHGDSSVYDAMVKMAQDFSMRYQLVQGQGNFGCFTKDTKVRLADGRSLSFEDLVAEDVAGKRNYTFTVTGTGAITVAQIEKPRVTIRNAELVEVTLDNGEKIRCTPNHRFLLKDLTYVEAQDLVPGTSLMPLYTRTSTNQDAPLERMTGYEMVFQPLAGNWQFTHQLADAYNLAHDIYRAADGRVRHHVDFNKLNNSPENIHRMHWAAHRRLHAALAADRHANDPAYVHALATGRAAYWANPEHKEKQSKRMAARNRAAWQDPQYRMHKKETLSAASKAYIAAHPELRTVFSQRATQTLQHLWQQPEYRAAMHEKIVRANQQRTTNQTGKVKFDAICAAMIERGKPLTELFYELKRSELYPYGSATTWQTGLSRYYGNDVARIQAEVVGNHKVVQVRALTEREDVYDLTIPVTHNFALAAGVFVHNSVDGDNAAAMRYTEARMSKIASELLRDIEKDTVDFRPNYDATRKEPEVLPAAVPNLLLNGTLGIAVGMATNIAPHNLGEIVDACLHLIDNDDATNEDLAEIVKGPDFPTGGIAFNKADIAHAFASGRGGVVCRGEAEIIEQKNGVYHIVITSLPYQVNKATFIEAIATLVQEKKIEGIKDIQELSTKDMHVVVVLKNGTNPQKVLNYLYKHTQLEQTFHYNMVALVDGTPETLSLKSILSAFIGHREVVVRRRTAFDLKKAKEREHILLGLKKALDHIDKVISTIRGSKDAAVAKVNLIKEFKFSDLQADAILEMRLQKLAGLERKAVETELKEKQDLIAELEALLASAKKIFKVIADELREIREKYGDERKTKIMSGGTKMISDEDLVPEKETVLVFTSGGYVKRTDPSEYRTQKRGGVGVIDLETKEEDFVTMLLTTDTHSDLLFFTNKGKAYQIKMYELPEGRRATKGKSIMNFLSLAGDEQVTSILAVPKKAKAEKASLMLVTKKGTAKKVAYDSFKDVRRSGIIAIRLDAGDELQNVLRVQSGQSVILATAEGQSIRFAEKDIREMGRAAGGVRAMKLTKNDHIVGADVVLSEENTFMLTLGANGLGKKTAIDEYKVQKRGGSGIKTAKVTPKTGKIMVGKVVGMESELVAMSKKGQVIRVDLTTIPSSGRQTQGVTIMKLRAGDELASVTCL